MKLKLVAASLFSLYFITTNVNAEYLHDSFFYRKYLTLYIFLLTYDGDKYG